MAFERALLSMAHIPSIIGGLESSLKKGSMFELVGEGVEARERSVKIELERGVDRSCWCMSVNREGLSLCIPETLQLGT